MCKTSKYFYIHVEHHFCIYKFQLIFISVSGHNKNNFRKSAQKEQKGSDIIRAFLQRHLTTASRKHFVATNGVYFFYEQILDESIIKRTKFSHHVY